MQRQVGERPPVRAAHTGSWAGARRAAGLGRRQPSLDRDRMRVEVEGVNPQGRRDEGRFERRHRYPPHNTA